MSAVEYTTFPSISQAEPTYIPVPVTTTAIVGPSNLPGNQVSIYEAGGTTTSVPLPGTTSIPSGNKDLKLELGLGIGLGGTVLLALLGLGFVFYQRRKIRISFEKRTQILKTAESVTATSEMREADGTAV